MSTTAPAPRRVIVLDDDTFWAVQSGRDHLGTTAEALEALTRTARIATVAIGIIAGAATVAAAAAIVGEVRR